MKCVKCTKEVRGRNVCCPGCCDADNKIKMCYTCGTEVLEKNFTKPTCYCGQVWNQGFIENTFSKSLIDKLTPKAEPEQDPNCSEEKPSRAQVVKKVIGKDLDSNKKRMEKTKAKLAALQKKEKDLLQELEDLTRAMTLGNETEDLRRKKRAM